MLTDRTKVRDYVEEANLFGRRALVAFMVTIGLVGVLIANLYHLQVSEFQDYQTRSNDNRIKILPIAPNRGRIYDRNGVLLAENRAVTSLQLIPREVKNIDETLERLQSVVAITPAEIQRFRKKLRQTARFKPVIIKDQLNEKEIARFSANQ
ncbi:penicillin-binding protein 2, partial [Veronia nyctiphanis]